jgi:signal transduction histidine kinase
VARLLLADDQPQELEILESILAGEGHTCTRARDGAEALKRFNAERPDLVILDVLMPGMDGIKATRKLKQQSQGAGAYVPVLLVTGLDDVEDRLAGFDAGADDFLTKPVEDWELRARVRTFLQIAAQQRATEDALRKVRELQAFRDELIELLVHDLKNPLACLSSNLAFVESRLSTDEEGNEALADCRDSTARLLRMVTVILDVNRLEERKLTPARRMESARVLLEASARGRGHEAGFRGIRIAVEGDPALALRVDVDLMGRVLDNLLDNALRYTPKDGVIRLAAEARPHGVALSVANSGSPIPERDRGRIFSKYERLPTSRGPRGANRGLGLYFCRLAVEAHGGSISVDDDGGEGTRFFIELPA